MALRIHPLPLIAVPRPPKSRLHHICFNAHKSLVVSVSCTGKENGNAEVASALAAEVARVHARKKQKDEALSKSRALLFSELCGYLSLSEDEFRKKWERTADGERRDLAKEFVSNWSVHFHPLSARSVVEMVEEHLQQEKKPSFSHESTFFPSLKRLMGLGESK